MKNNIYWIPVLIAISTGILLIYNGPRPVKQEAEVPPIVDQNNTENINDNPVFCTQDAMQCPDGSYVGRSGPNCEFVCSGVSTK